jgi:hypothetical protein
MRSTSTTSLVSLTTRIHIGRTSPPISDGLNADTRLQVRHP